jgi:hypothetical protein
MTLQEKKALQEIIALKQLSPEEKLEIISRIISDSKTINEG